MQQHLARVFVGGLLLLLVPSIAAAQTATTTSCSLSASPERINQGNSTRLTWAGTASSTSGYITGIGPVATSGALTVSPSQTVRFSGTFSGRDGVGQCSVLVTVSASNGRRITLPQGGSYTPGVGVRLTPNANGQCQTGYTLSGGRCTFSCPSGQENIPTPEGIPGCFPSNALTPVSFLCAGAGEIDCPTPDGEERCMPASSCTTRGTGTGTGSPGSVGVTPLPPGSGEGGLVPCYGWADCGCSKFVSLLQNIINYLVGLSVPIAVALFAWAGVLYFTSGANPSNVKKAKEIFQTGLIGFLLVIAGWTLVQTIMNVLVRGYSDWQWNGLQCSNLERMQPKKIDEWLGNTFPGTFTGTTQSPVGGGVGYGNDFEIRNTLTTESGFAANPVNKADCTVQGQTNCTSLDGISPAAISGARSIAADCLLANNNSSCNVQITGGTEAGHSNGHTSGNKLDFGKNPNIDRFIQAWTNAGVRGDGAQQYRRGNVLCANETTQGTAPHWDCSF